MAMRLMKCPVKNLAIGMVLAQDTFVGNGSLVLDAGTKVDQECINMLVQGNVQFVIVEVDNSNPLPNESENKVNNIPTAPPPPPQKKEQWVNKKKLMFRDCIDDRYMGNLYRIVCDIDGEE